MYCMRESRATTYYRRVTILATSMLKQTLASLQDRLQSTHNITNQPQVLLVMLHNDVRLPLPLWNSDGDNLLCQYPAL